MRKSGRLLEKEEIKKESGKRKIEEEYDSTIKTVDFLEKYEYKKQKTTKKKEASTKRKSREEEEEEEAKETHRSLSRKPKLPIKINDNDPVKPGVDVATRNDKAKPSKSQQVPYRCEILKEKYGKCSKKYVGAHISAAGGIENAVYNAARIGAKSFALFTKSHRSWSYSPLPEANVIAFHEAMKKYKYESKHVVAHGSYLMNCGSSNEETMEKSKLCFLEEVNRCERLGIQYYNFHPGSTCGQISIEQGIENIANMINYIHGKTCWVIILIENMSLQGNTIGGHFHELKQILRLVQDQTRIGICFDTCHAFAAGYDLRDPIAFQHTFQQFDEIVGLSYLHALHLNDSKGSLGCHLDRHEKIGKGAIGKQAFQLLMNDTRFDHIPIILETPTLNKKDPSDEYEQEIQLLYSLQPTHNDSDESTTEDQHKQQKDSPPQC